MSDEARAAIWYCKIGEVPRGKLPHTADAPMRDAVSKCFKELTGEYPGFIFSGWGAELTEGERAVVENRMPREQASRPVTDAEITLAMSDDYSARYKASGPVTDAEVEAAMSAYWCGHIPNNSDSYLSDTMRAALEAAAKVRESSCEYGHPKCAGAMPEVREEETPRQDVVLAAIQAYEQAESNASTHGGKPYAMMVAALKAAARKVREGK
jgi:hypothetical protein